MPSPAVTAISQLPMTTLDGQQQQHDYKRPVSPATPVDNTLSSSPATMSTQLTDRLSEVPMTSQGTADFNHRPERPERPTLYTAESQMGIGSMANYTPSVAARSTLATMLEQNPPSKISATPDSHLGKQTKQTANKVAKTLDVVEEAKKLAAYTAVDRHVKPEHKVIGIGSGSTVPYVVDRILHQGEDVNAGRWFIPTGFQSKELIVKAGLHLGDVDQFPVIDITIDGADEVDHQLNVIKGGGACHLREKVLAEAALEFIIVADHRKNSAVLGQSWQQGVPIEVIPFAWSKVFQNLTTVPGVVTPKLRMGKAKAGPVVTDNGNFVIDAIFDELHMRSPEDLLHKIKMLTGVVEVGLFCGMAKAAYFGNADGSVSVRWDDGQVDRVDKRKELEKEDSEKEDSE